MTSSPSPAPAWVRSATLVVMLVLLAPLLNGLFQILGIQDEKFGLAIFRSPVGQAAGWFLIGGCTMLLMSASKGR